MTVTGGRAIADALVAHGVDTVFGLPGAQIYDLFEGFAAAGLHVIGARHEQACSLMALGYAMASGKPGVFSVVPGPGILNAGAGIVSALGRYPLLCLTGAVPHAFFGRGRGHLHELPDQLQTLRGLTKWSAHIDGVDAAPGLVAEAFKQMLSGRPGPAALQMCWDRFGQLGDVAPVPPLPRLAAPPPDSAMIERAAEAIRNAKAPMIMVGSGALGAVDGVRALAQRTGAPVMSFRSGRGIVGDEEPNGLNIATAHRLWPETDLGIGIGSRLEAPGWRWPRRADPPPIVQIDIDAKVFERSGAAIGIEADAAEGVQALLDALADHRPAADGGRIAAAKAVVARDIQSIQPQVAYLEALRSALPDDGIVVDELSQVGFASWFAFPVRRPRTYLSTGFQGALGAGFPLALGAKVARPDVPVVSVTGDGGFMFAVAELATAKQYGIDVVTLLFNNESYGNVRRDQLALYDGRVVGAELANPDFMALANAFGIEGARVSTPRALEETLRRAFRKGGAWLIEVPVERGTEASPWKFIHPAPIA